MDKNRMRKQTLRLMAVGGMIGTMLLSAESALADITYDGNGEPVAFSFDELSYSSAGIDVLNTSLGQAVYDYHQTSTGLGVVIQIPNDWSEMNAAEYGAVGSPGHEYYDAGNMNTAEFMSIDIIPKEESPESNAGLYQMITDRGYYSFGSKDDIVCGQINGRNAFFCDMTDSNGYWYVDTFMFLPDGRVLNLSVGGSEYSSELLNDFQNILVGMEVDGSAFYTLDTGDPGLDPGYGMEEYSEETMNALGVYRAVSCTYDGVDFLDEGEYIELQTDGIAECMYGNDYRYPSWIVDGTTLYLEDEVNGEYVEAQGTISEGKIEIEYMGYDYVYEREE